MRYFTTFLLTLFCLSSACGQDRDSWQQPERIIDSVGIHQGMVIGEIGAGMGYFTVHLDRRVGKGGIVYANDIDSKSLNKLRSMVSDGDLKQVVVVEGASDDPLLPDSTLDMVITMLAVHDFSDPVAMLTNIKNDLKPGANLVIIDRDTDRWPHGQDHFFSEQEMIKLINQSGFRVVKVFRFLQRDNIYICSPH